MTNDELFMAMLDAQIRVKEAQDALREEISKLVKLTDVARYRYRQRQAAVATREAHE